MASTDDLEFVLRHYLPKSTKWWLGRLLAIGQAAGSDLVLCDLDMPVTDNVASADKVLAALEKAGIIARPGRPVPHTYPHGWTWVIGDRARLLELVDRGAP